ncbi:hypothetical protein RAS2_16940 [Phycisphaerae bacterium RAS2]|nr:hypothetical protein RAS2_16940 [Phycisphaerae bacterium RAS2]
MARMGLIAGVALMFGAVAMESMGEPRMATTVELVINGSNTGTARNNDGTFSRIEDGDASYVSEGTADVRKSYGYFNLAKVPKGTVLDSLQVQFEVTDVSDATSNLFAWCLFQDYRGTDTDEELFNRIAAYVSANDISQTATTVGLKTLTFPAGTVQLLNSLLELGELPSIGIGLAGDDAIQQIGCRIGDEWRLIAVCKTLECPNPFDDQRIGKRIDSAFPRLAVVGPRMSSILDLLFRQLVSNKSRMEQAGRFAINRHESRGFSFEVEKGLIHNGRGQVVGELQEQETVPVDDATENFIEYDPDQDEIAVNADGFTPGRISLHRVPQAATSKPTGLYEDARPSCAILYGKRIGPLNLVDGLGAEFGSIEFEAAAQVDDEIVVTATLKDFEGATIEQSRIVEVWLGDSPYGWLTTAEPAAFEVHEAGTELEAVTAGKRLRVETIGGEVEFSVRSVEARTYYLHAELDDGRLFVSEAIEFEASE